MKKTLTICLVMSVFVLFSIQPAVATEPGCPGGDCSSIYASGDVWGDAMQNQDVYHEDSPCGLDAYTSTNGWQGIYAESHGDPMTSVGFEAQQAQYDPYSFTSFMAHGTSEHFGEAYQRQDINVETNSGCQYLGVDMESGRSSYTNTYMDGETMNSVISSWAGVSSGLMGANIEFSGVNEQYNGYFMARDNGSYQEGFVGTSIMSSNMPD